MKISLKCQYAIRGVMELARRHGQGPVSIADIASTYEISPRFLEIILNELKQGGLIESRRGVQGGFFLAVEPGKLTVGDIVMLVDGPQEPCECVVGRDRRPCPKKSNCPLPPLWREAQQAVEGIYRSASFEMLLQRERNGGAAEYHI